MLLLLCALLVICGFLVFLVFHYAWQLHLAYSPKLSDEVRRSNLPEERKLTLLIDAVKMENSRTAWFERSLSSIGVVVFMTTLGAAGVQAWQAETARREASIIKVEQQRLRAEAQTQKQLLEIGAEQLLQNYDRNLSLTEAERALLQKTVEYRLQKTRRTSSDTRFLFRAYTILDDWTSASVLLLGSSTSEVAANNPQDTVTAAIRLYILGEPEASLRALEALDLSRQEISNGARMDAWSVRWMVDPDQHETLATAAALALHIDRAAAERALADRSLKLRQIAERRADTKSKAKAGG